MQTHSKHRKQRQPLGSELLSPPKTQPGPPMANRKTKHRPTNALLKKEGNKETNAQPQRTGKENNEENPIYLTKAKNPNQNPTCNLKLQTPSGLRATTMNHNNRQPQASSLTLSLDSDWNWSLIDHRGRTATKNRPSQSLPMGVPTRKSQPQVGGVAPVSMAEVHTLCS